MSPGEGVGVTRSVYSDNSRGESLLRRSVDAVIKSLQETLVASRQHSKTQLDVSTTTASARKKKHKKKKKPPPISWRLRSADDLARTRDPLSFLEQRRRIDTLPLELVDQIYCQMSVTCSHLQLSKAEAKMVIDQLLLPCFLRPDSLFLDLSFVSAAVDDYFLYQLILPTELSSFPSSTSTATATTSAPSPVDDWEQLADEPVIPNCTRPLVVSPGLPDLRSLSLSSCSCSDLAITTLLTSPRLQDRLVHLDLSRCCSLTTLSLDLPVLSSLDVSFTHFTRFLVNVPALRLLAYKNCMVGRQITKPFAACVRLQALDLASSHDLDANILRDVLGAFPRLQFLNLSRSPGLSFNTLCSPIFLTSVATKALQLKQVLLCGIDLSLTCAITLVSQLPLERLSLDLSQNPCIQRHAQLVARARDLSSSIQHDDFSDPVYTLELSEKMSSLTNRAAEIDFEWRTSGRWQHHQQQTNMND